MLSVSLSPKVFTLRVSTLNIYWIKKNYNRTLSSLVLTPTHLSLHRQSGDRPTVDRKRGKHRRQKRQGLSGHSPGGRIRKPLSPSVSHRTRTQKPGRDHLRRFKRRKWKHSSPFVCSIGASQSLDLFAGKRLQHRRHQRRRVHSHPFGGKVRSRVRRSLPGRVRSRSQHHTRKRWARSATRHNWHNPECAFFFSDLS